ncbi:MAG: Sensory transduction histidine kinase [Oscillospiraceae bacterium]|nr:Sensory transduction histidine kinase [Oscillospiraceae bacterium]
MKELSLHILDIAQNSIEAGATRLELTLSEDGKGALTVVIRDNGHGMSPELLKTATDPFTTTRTTRTVGLGLPLFQLCAQQTGGGLRVESSLNEGTTVTAVAHRGHIDCPPLGDIAGTVSILTRSSPNLTLFFRHTTPLGTFSFSTEEAREILGSDIALSEPAVTLWIQAYIKENETLLYD